MLRISMGLIARNVEKTIKPCIESFIKEVDQCVVVLGGESTDKTVSILEKLAKKYKHLEICPFEWCDDFSVARNFCFSKLDGDWLCWCDADDEIYQAENIRKLAENAPPDVGAIWFPYHYAIDEFGNPTTVYERERLLRASLGWVWRNRVHETVSPLNQCRYERSEDVIYRHNHHVGGARGERNFKLLNIMLKEDPNDKRIWLYLGHQNFAAGNWSEAAEWYLKFGSDEGAVPIERYQALCYCSKAMRELRDRQSIEVALMATSLFPEYRDGYLELAHCHLVFDEYDKAIHYANLADVKELIKEPPAIIFINPLDYTFNKLCLLAEAYSKKGQQEKSMDYLSQAFRIRPTADVQKQLQYLRNLALKDKIIESIQILTVHLLENREYTKLQYLPKIVPFWFKDLPEYSELTGGLKRYTADLKDETEVVESENNIIVNIGKSFDPKKKLEELDEKKKRVTVVCPITSDNQINVFSQLDMEELVTSADGRHIINLRKEPNRITCEYDHNVPDGLTVRFFCGKGLENWNPQTIEEIGCGGSETAVARIAQGMAKMNCYPIIYAMDNQVWDGVVYREHTKYQPEAIPCHLFISSRVPSVFAAPIPAKQRWLYVHDIHCWDQLSPEMANEIDVIVTISHWQTEHFKRVYPYLKDAEVIDLDNNPELFKDEWTAATYFEGGKANRLPKFAIIGNGLDVERFKVKEEKIPHRFIWCSSPDRGLEELLNIWPTIKKGLPDAELKIFYGWEYFNSSLFIPAQRELKKRLLKLIKQDGVEWCGRVGQKQLARELLKADAMVYPPHDFRETYGIAFLEAQMAGVICFYRMNGALGETINKRGIPLPLDSKPEDVVNKILTTLQNEEKCAMLRKRGKEYALKRTWDVQAKKMLDLYKSIEEAKK